MVPGNPHDLIKERAKRKPDAIIKGIDPISISLLRQMYSALKDRGENLGLYEKIWVNEIEKIYSDQDTFNEYFIHGLDSLLKQAYRLLSDNSKPWDIKKDEVYSILEKIVFLKSRDDVFKPFFDDVEKTIFSALQLDFSKRVNLTKIGKSQENIFSYAAIMLNMLFETLEDSVISASAANEILSDIPGLITVITDKAGKIRFINNLGETVLRAEHNTLINKPIINLFGELETLSKEIKEKGFVKNKSLILTLRNDKSKKISTNVKVVSSSASSAVKEVIYLIKVLDTYKTSTEIDLRQKIHDKLAPLNTILGGLNLLEKKLIDADSKKLIQGLKNTAEKLKETSNDELKLLFSSSSKTSEPVEFINVCEVLDEIIESLSLNKGFDKIEFIQEIHSFNFYSKRKLFYSILQNLLDNAIKYSRYQAKNRISIHFSEQSIDCFVLKISDTGMGIKKNDLKSIFMSQKRVSRKTEGHGVGLNLVKSYVKKLKGTIEVDSTYGIGSTFTIHLPNLKQK